MDAGVTIDFGTLPQWASTAAALVAVLISALSLVRGARRAEMQLAHDRINDVKATLGGHGDRLTRVESELEHLPTREMVTDLATSLARIEGQMGALNAKFDGVGDRMRHLENAVEQLVENELRGHRG